jgi:phosphate butyryltransferase
MKNFDELLENVRQHPRKRVAVAAAHHESVLEAVRDAAEHDVATSLLVGRREEILPLAEKVGLKVADDQIVEASTDVDAARVAAFAVRCDQADILMKGQLHTDDFLRAVLDKERGLRAGFVMSHVFLLELADQERIVMVTDGAMNIAPDLETKAKIIMNAVYLARIFGIQRPRVAVLGAVELVNPAMPITMEAAALAKMSERGQFPDCIIDGPLALDNAVDLLAARTKKIQSDVAGQADILVVPDIEAGNILAKAHSFLGRGRVAGVVVGALAPVVLTSRADSAEAKLLSIAAAVLMANLDRSERLKIGKVHY